MVVHEQIRQWAYTGMVVSISLLMLIAVLLFAWNVEEATPWRAMKPADWGVWIGSIGAVGAFLGTIWLATSERRRREREAMDAATLAASSIFLKIALTIGSVNRVIDALERTSDNPKLFGYCNFVISKIERCTNEELLPLIPLPNHTAAKLGLVMQALTVIQRHCQTAQTSPGNSQENVRDLIIQTKAILNALEEAAAECKRLAKVLDKRFIGI